MRQSVLKKKRTNKITIKRGRIEKRLIEATFDMKNNWLISWSDGPYKRKCKFFDNKDMASCQSVMMNP